MLVTVDCICCQERFDSIGFSVFECDSDMIVEFFGKFFPVFDSSIGEDSLSLVECSGAKIDTISVLVRAPISTNKNRSDSIFDCVSI
jgi:hypothetical protein